MITKSKCSKKNKDFVISARYSEDEYMDVLFKITDENGQQIMSPGAFSKSATLSAKVTLVDSELERYRVFVAAKMGSNINQIARGLNADRISEKINESTYESVMKELEKLVIQLNKLLEPLR